MSDGCRLCYIVGELVLISSALYLFYMKRYINSLLHLRSCQRKKEKPQIMHGQLHNRQMFKNF